MSAQGWTWKQPVGTAVLEDMVVLDKMRNFAERQAKRDGAFLSDQPPEVIRSGAGEVWLMWTGVLPQTGQS